MVITSRLAGTATGSLHTPQRIAPKSVAHVFLALGLRPCDITESMPRGHRRACGGHQCFSGRLCSVAVSVGLCAQPSSGSLSDRSKLSDQSKPPIIILRKHQLHPPLYFEGCLPV